MRPITGSLLIAASLLATPSAAAGLVCPLTRAVYTALDADDDMSADAGVANSYEITHLRRPNDGDRPWVIHVAEIRQKLAYDFAVAHPPGFGGTHVFMVPLGKAAAKRIAATAPSSRLYYFGDDLRRIDPDAEPEPQAPPFLQLPGLSPAFWDWKRDGRRFVPPDGMWKLTACRD